MLDVHMLPSEKRIHSLEFTLFYFSYPIPTGFSSVNNLYHLHFYSIAAFIICIVTFPPISSLY